MNLNLENGAIILSIIRKLNEKGSWCGETHIQKSMYFIEKLFPELADYEFILYKYGPFSFEVRDDIGILLSDNFLELNPSSKDGPRLSNGKNSRLLEEFFKDKIKENNEKISFVVDALATKKVTELEALASALYVDTKKPSAKLEEKIQKLQKLKPHIKEKQAEDAFKQLEIIKKEKEEIK